MVLKKQCTQEHLGDQEQKCKAVPASSRTFDGERRHLYIRRQGSGKKRTALSPKITQSFQAQQTSCVEPKALEPHFNLVSLNMSSHRFLATADIFDQPNTISCNEPGICENKSLPISSDKIQVESSCPKVFEIKDNVNASKCVNQATLPLCKHAETMKSLSNVFSCAFMEGLARKARQPKKSSSKLIVLTESLDDGGSKKISSGQTEFSDCLNDVCSSSFEEENKPAKAREFDQHQPKSINVITLEKLAENALQTINEQVSTPRNILSQDKVNTETRFVEKTQDENQEFHSKSPCFNDDAALNQDLLPQPIPTMDSIGHLNHQPLYPIMPSAVPCMPFNPVVASSLSIAHPPFSPTVPPSLGYINGHAFDQQISNFSMCGSATFWHPPRFSGAFIYQNSPFSVNNEVDPHFGFRGLNPW
ncbi:hypothetical protein PoB_000879000 [Plakobranchus ocellatus]|uniref:Uncharacterized protein n=1 Tax=Plakobranchus ocellatus TaxID=259542 RepID=A0AAV3YID7_9GAST|nr:hypothetical protein PoB_000879000 [Plakobranchus ocellatus]